MQTPDQAQEHAKYIDERRAFLAANREKYEQALEGLTVLARDILTKIGLRLMTVNSDSPPSKALWIVAQCREILTEFSGELKLINDFESAKAKVLKYDEEHKGS